MVLTGVHDAMPGVILQAALTLSAAARRRGADMDAEMKVIGTDWKIGFLAFAFSVKKVKRGASSSLLALPRKREKRRYTQRVFGALTINPKVTRVAPLHLTNVPMTTGTEATANENSTDILSENLWPGFDKFKDVQVRDR